MSKQHGTTFSQVLMVAALAMVGGLLLMFFVLPIIACGCGGSSAKKAASAQNNRQMALSAIMYGGDYDDRIPLTTNGWLSRMQDVADGQLTLDAPSTGTQKEPARSAGAKRTDAWPLLIKPYVRSRGLYVNPGLPDVHSIWSKDPTGYAERNYSEEGATYRNQNRYPFYGMNYMFLSPLRIPAEKRKLKDAVNFAVSESRKFAQADDPSATVFFTESQRSEHDQTRGFFVVNAPGMWSAFESNETGYMAFWTGQPGSGDWIKPAKAANFVYTGFSGGCNASFLDGHVKYCKASALASGTDYSSGGGTGQPARIIDKSKYLWNLSDDEFFGQ